MLTDEIGLGRRFAAGEPDSVAEAYRCYGALVYAVAYRVLGDAGAAEDACQLTFVQAWQNAASFDPSRRLGPWLATIAGRAAIDVYRLNRRHRDHSKLESLAAPEQGTSPGPSAEQIYDVWEVRLRCRHSSASAVDRTYLAAALPRLHPRRSPPASPFPWAR